MRFSCSYTVLLGYRPELRSLSEAIRPLKDPSIP
nr:MAG TPA: hypothetical protein [Bacteriophage sp.]